MILPRIHPKYTATPTAQIARDTHVALLDSPSGLVRIAMINTNQAMARDATGVPQRPDWSLARGKAQQILSHTGKNLLTALGSARWTPNPQRRMTRGMAGRSDLDAVTSTRVAAAQGTSLVTHPDRSSSYPTGLVGCSIGVTVHLDVTSSAKASAPGLVARLRAHESDPWRAWPRV